jgi:hypothetical protein
MHDTPLPELPLCVVGRIHPSNRFIVKRDDELGRSGWQHVLEVPKGFFSPTQPDAVNRGIERE